MHLARYAERVTILIRSDSLTQSMSDYLIREIDAARNVNVRPFIDVVGGGGDGRLEWLELRDRRTGEAETVSAAAVFVLIGARPNTDWLEGVVARDRWGYILTGDDITRHGAAWPDERAPLPVETSLPGVFAVGDVRHGSVKRVASAVGEGSMAVRLVHEHLASLAGVARRAVLGHGSECTGGAVRRRWSLDLADLLLGDAAEEDRHGGARLGGSGEGLGRHVRDPVARGSGVIADRVVDRGCGGRRGVDLDGGGLGRLDVPVGVGGGVRDARRPLGGDSERGRGAGEIRCGGSSAPGP